MTKDQYFTAVRWVLVPFAALFGFVAAVLLTMPLNRVIHGILWSNGHEMPNKLFIDYVMPYYGALAASLVLLCGTLMAPAYHRQVAAVLLLVGGWIAWGDVGHSYSPLWNKGVPIREWSPAIGTYLGGFVTFLILCIIFGGKKGHSAPAVVVLISLCAAVSGRSQTPSTPQPASSPATPQTIDVFSPDTLPGRGLTQHPFLYAGETERRRPEQTMSVVRDGKVVWTYSIPGKDSAGRAQELSDAWMLSNGNILFARETGAMELTPAKKVIWDYDAPPGCEVHAIQPVGKDSVFLLQSGTPAQAMIVNTTTGAVEKQTVIPADPPPHSQFRHARLTAAGTILAAHLNEGRVAEYDWSGKEIWSLPASSVWAATRLKNGNTLISLEHTGVREVDPHGKTVWEFTQADVPGITLVSIQEASRLANGNTLICNWTSGRVPLAQWPKAVQLLEVTPGKKVVWALRSWTGKADLGPATSVQLLDEPGTPETPGQLQR